MMPRPRLVFVHGRAQQGKDAAALKEIWLDTLRVGLGTRAGVLDGLHIDLPFYGDLLDEYVRGMAQALPPSILVRGEAPASDPAFLQFQFDLLEEIRRRENISEGQIAAQMEGDVRERGPLNWRWVQAIMRVLDKIPGLSGDMIERFTLDAWVYLTRAKARRTVNDLVAEAMPAGEPLVIIGHSLGSVVAYDLLRENPSIEALLFLTVGSPLGLGAIKNQVLPLVHPSGVRRWFNAHDRRDSVALYPLDTVNFPIEPPIEDYDGVRNRTENAHGISGYLNDSRIGEVVCEALA